MSKAMIIQLCWLRDKIISFISWFISFWPFEWTKLNSIHPRMRCAKLVEIDPLLLDKMFSNFLYEILQNHYYLPFERMWSFTWTNLNLFHPWLLCAKFGWNFLSGSGEEDKNMWRVYRQMGRIWTTSDQVS